VAHKSTLMLEKSTGGGAPRERMWRQCLHHRLWSRCDWQALGMLLRAGTGNIISIDAWRIDNVTFR
jgi:hypothetical protein